MAAPPLFKDPARSFSPLGRPMRKPKKVVMRLASLSTAPRSELEDYLIMERPTRAWKYMSPQERTESRPPVLGDLDGPTPCTYSVRSQQLSVGGTKINPKTKYKRDALPYPNTEIWTHNVCVSGKCPGPTKYKAPNVFGRNCPTKQDAPAFSMGHRTAMTMGRKGADKEPAPNSYLSAKSIAYTFTNHPAFTMGTRNDHRRTTSTPGPAHYYPNYSATQYTCPAFSFRYRTATV